MDFSLRDYLDEDACYTKLVALLHPHGLACPRCGERQHLGIHRLSVRIGEGTTVAAKWARGCYQWVAAKWYPAAWLGNAS